MTTLAAEKPKASAPARAWLSLLAVALGIMVMQIDGTVVAIANPSIAADLHASLEGIQWVTTGYLLVLAGLLIPAGTVADKIGRKKAFLIGIGGFTLASLLAGFAGSIEMLIAARVVQAVFGSLLGPAGLAVLRASFPAEKLPAAFGWFGAVSAVALAGGPILGGVIIENASWPWVFFVNLPVGVIAVAVGLLVITESTERQQHKLDLPGALTLTAAMVSFVWGITRAQESGWGSANTLGFIAGGLVLLAVFVVIERRSQHPMVPLHLFRNRSFSTGSVLMIVTMFAFYAIIFYLTFFLQGVQGKGGIPAAVALLPLTAVFTVASPAAGWVTGRLGLRPTLLAGALFTTASLALLLRLDAESGFWTLAPPLVLAGFGAGFMMVPAIQAIVANAPVDKAGVASGVQQSMQQLGGTVGVAVFGTLLSSVVSSRFPTEVREAFGGTAADQLAGNENVQAGVELGFGPASQEAVAQSGLSADGVRKLTQAAHETFLSGIHTVFLVAAGIAVVAGLISLLIKKS